MTENIIELCDKEIDETKDMCFEVIDKKTKLKGYLNIDSQDDDDLEGHGTWITSKFCWTTYGANLIKCPINKIFMEDEEFVIKRIK